MPSTMTLAGRKYVSSSLRQSVCCRHSFFDSFIASLALLFIWPLLDGSSPTGGDLDGHVTSSEADIHETSTLIVSSVNGRHFWGDRQLFSISWRWPEAANSVALDALVDLIRSVCVLYF